jgi:1,2-diacylglycerol 3-alpha-glucosyltransferase
MGHQPIPVRCRVVVIWIDWYPYHVARFRGLVDAFPSQGVGIELVGGVGVHAGLKFREDLPSDLPIHTLMPDTSWRKANALQIAFKLWRKLLELKPKVVLVPGYYTLPAMAAALWARTHSAESVLMTESTADDHPRVRWKEALKSWIIRSFFDWAVVGGQSHVGYLRQLGFAPEKITNFYDVVDNNFFEDGTQRLRSAMIPDGHAEGPPQTDYFLYVGRLAGEKNVSTLLSSWITYRNKGGTWPLILVGDGPDAERLRTLANASPYSASVYFPGLKSSRELLPFYAFAGCFVLPSTREPWGLVVNEALAAGLPVIVSSLCGCASDLVSPRENGFLFDPRDPAALTDLLHLMESLDEQQRASMRDASLRIIRPYSPQNFGQSILSIAETIRVSPAQVLVEGGQ